MKLPEGNHDGEVVEVMNGKKQWDIMESTKHYIINDNESFFFPRMRSKASRFTLGSEGFLKLCSLDVAQPSATVRNRSCEVVWPCLW